MRHGVPLLCMNKGGEQNGITNEEDGGVVPHQVPIALLRVKLHRKPTWVTCSIRTPRFTPHGGEADGDRGALPDGREELGTAVVFDLGLCHFEVAEGTCTFGVDDAFGDAFTIEVGEGVDEIEVL